VSELHEAVKVCSEFAPPRIGKAILDALRDPVGVDKVVRCRHAVEEACICSGVHVVLCCIALYCVVLCCVVLCCVVLCRVAMID
jgi:hypothetical protein